MRILVISDVHANLPALRAVLEEVGKADMVLHAGDIVGYNPFPNEAIEELSALGARSVMGNHDYSVGFGDVSYMNPIAEVADLWTMQVLKPGYVSRLRALPRSMKLQLGGLRIHVVHGAPPDDIFTYIFPWDVGAWLLDRARADVLVLGHSHIQFKREFENGVVLNPGSVGQPRDGDPRAAFAILEISDSYDIELGRVEYPIEEVKRAILEAGLPWELAARLDEGL